MRRLLVLSALLAACAGSPPVQPPPAPPPSSFRLGPIVGMQPMHAFTVHRLPIHVKGPESEDLGRLRVALSQSELQEGKSIEGEPIPLDWEAPRTFETRKTWVKQAVREARRRLVTR